MNINAQLLREVRLAGLSRKSRHQHVRAVSRVIDASMAFEDPRAQRVREGIEI